MAGEQMKPVASLLLVLNFCMYVIVLGIGGWAMNRAIDHGFEIGKNTIKIETHLQLGLGCYNISVLLKSNLSRP